MNHIIPPNCCVHCQSSDDEVPLLTFQFQGTQGKICSRCLPILIHKPHELGADLEGASKIRPADHET